MAHFNASQLVVLLLVHVLLLGTAGAFQQPSTPLLPRSVSVSSSSSTVTTNSALYSKDNNSDNDYMRWARASRSASADDNVVELLRPLGLVLNQDDYGNVYVETVAPRGNAARTGKVGSTNLYILY